MALELKKRLLFVFVVVVAGALAFAGPSLIAGIKDTAIAADAPAKGGCAMEHGSSGGGCGMMGDMHGDAKMSNHGCAMLTGKVVAANKRDGSVTVKVKPAAQGADATKKALGQLKVGDTLSMAMMTGKDGKPVAADSGAKAQKATYSCPMHPEVTSNNPDDRCPKCGMYLEKTKK